MILRKRLHQQTIVFCKTSLNRSSSALIHLFMLLIDASSFIFILFQQLSFYDKFRKFKIEFPEFVKQKDNLTLFIV
jgi:hypothetical protein